MKVFKWLRDLLKGTREARVKRRPELVEKKDVEEARKLAKLAKWRTDREALKARREREQQANKRRDLGRFMKHGRQLPSYRKSVHAKVPVEEKEEEEG